MTREERAALTSAPPCPICGATTRPMSEYLAASCGTCRRDTLEDHQPGFYECPAAREMFPLHQAYVDRFGDQ